MEQIKKQYKMYKDINWSENYEKNKRFNFPLSLIVGSNYIRTGIALNNMLAAILFHVLILRKKLTTAGRTSLLNTLDNSIKLEIKEWV